jgi:hypothetical protein
MKKLIFIFILFFSSYAFSNDKYHLECKNIATNEDFLFSVNIAENAGVYITELGSYGYIRKYLENFGYSNSYIIANLDPHIDDEFQKGRIILNRVNGRGKIELARNDNSEVVKTFECKKIDIKF